MPVDPQIQSLISAQAQRISDLEDLITKRLGPTYGNSSNYQNPSDLFHVMAGALESFHMAIGVFGIGPNGSLTEDSFTWSPNTPGAGSIAWSTGVVTYQGVQYLISAGNTSNFWVYWQLSNPNIFQTAALGGATTPSIPALGSDDFIIALNNNGGASIALCINLIGLNRVHRLIISSDSIFFVNTSSKVVAAFSIGGSEQGHITLWNSTQTAANTIDLDPNVPAITVGGVAITVP